MIKEKWNKVNEKCPWIKSVIIGGGVLVAANLLWWHGFKRGCAEAADESVKYVKETCPEAFELMMKALDEKG